MIELSLFNEQASLSYKQFGFNRMFAEYHTAADISYAGVQEAEPLLDLGEFCFGGGALCLEARVHVGHELRPFDLQAFQVGLQLIFFPRPTDDIFLELNAGS